MISIDMDARTLDLLVDEATLAERRKHWVKPDHGYKKGWLKFYAENVGPASTGAQLGE